MEVSLEIQSHYESELRACNCLQKDTIHPKAHLPASSQAESLPDYMSANVEFSLQVQSHRPNLLIR